MIENIVTVKSATFLPTKDGKKQYLSAVMVGAKGKENTQAIFNPELQKTVQEAHKNNSPLLIKLEKEGDFWNIKEAEITTGEAKAEPEQKRYYHDRHSQDAEDWTNIRTAVMQAVALETHQVPSGKVDVKEVMQNASEIFADMCVMKPEREH